MSVSFTHSQHFLRYLLVDTHCENHLCPANYFGANCDILCLFTNNCAGHYTCDLVTGAKVCYPGWETSETNCATRRYTGPSPDPQCPLTLTCQNGGTCFRQGCCCAPNWYGPECNVYCEQRNDCGGHYSCTPEGQRVCNPGWNGPNCEHRYRGNDLNTRDDQCPANYDCLNGGKKM